MVDEFDFHTAVFGVPEPFEVHDVDPNNLLRMLDRAKQLSTANPRLHNARSMVRTYVPGDVAAVRYNHAAGMALQSVGALNAYLYRMRHEPIEGEVLDSTLASMAGQGIACVRTVLNSTAYFLPPAAAQAIAGSHEPDAELIAALRLPYPNIFVLFGAPLRFEAATQWITAFTANSEYIQASKLAQSHVNDRWDTTVDAEADRNVPAGIALNGGELHGVCLVANDDSTVRDSVIWLVSTRSVTDSQELFAVIPGAFHSGGFSPIARSCAAIASWGDWTAPDLNDRVPDDLTPAQTRDFVRKGKWRRKEASGAYLGVHVLDVQRAINRAKDAAAATGRHVATHPRRGHFRRVRCGPRDNWHYEGRFIPWTLVNADGPWVDDGRVYRLPEPPDPSDRPELEDEE